MVVCCRYLQFSIRIGSGAAVGSCARPDSDTEMVIVQSTCNGGIDWHLLQQLEVSDKYTQPMYVQMKLSDLSLSCFISFLTVFIIIIIIIIIHEFHGDTSLKQNFRATANVAC